MTYVIYIYISAKQGLRNWTKNRVFNDMATYAVHWEKCNFKVCINN